MTRKYSDGRQALNALLDAADADPDRTRVPLADIDHAGMTAAETEKAYRLFEAAKASGAIEIRLVKAGLGRTRPGKIALLDPDKLAQFLGRSRSAAAASAAAGAVRAQLGDMPESLMSAFSEMEKSWSRAKAWRRIEVNDVNGAIQTFQLAKAIISRNSDDSIDERTFSGRTVSDTKVLARRRDAIISILIGAGLAPEDATLEHFGITAFPDHVQMRGPLLLATPGATIPLDVFYPSAAIPPEQIGLVKLVTKPSYLITIENKTSFQRYVRQIQDGSLVVYTAGFVSEPCAAFLKSVQDHDTPWFHWGDIDAGGLSIFHWLETKIAGERRISPHLMRLDLAMEYGIESVEKDPRLPKIARSNSGVAGLAKWLMSDPRARILEQEVLDPSAPDLGL